MKIEAVVLDIDGTLLTNDKEISPRTKEALIQIQKQGTKVILASGRPTTGMIKYAKELEMEHYEGFLVSFNGASVVDYNTGDTLFNQPIPAQLAKRILEHLKKFDVIPMVCHEEYMYVNDVFQNISALPKSLTSIINYEARGGNYKLCEKDDLAAFVSFPLNKILIAGEPEYLEANQKAISGPFEDKVSGMFSAPFYFEFTDQGVDKARALHAVLPHFRIDAENIISFGDGHNDCSIIDFAGTGVAMGNAVEELKGIADKVTLSNDEDGIAVVLEEYMQ